MRSRIGVGLGMAALGAAIALPLRVSAGGLAGLPHAGSGEPALCAPAVTGVNVTGQPQHAGPAGSSVTVTGTFASVGCSVTAVTLGSWTFGPSGQNAFSVGANGTSISLTLPAPTASAVPSGAVSVTEQDALGDSTTSNANFVFIETPTAAVDAPLPLEGSTEPVQGAGFTPFLSQQSGGLAGAAVSGAYQDCDSAGQTFPATVGSDTSLALSAPTAYCDGPLQLSFTAPYDTSQPIDCSDAPTAPTYNCIPVQVEAGDVDVFFYVSGVDPSPYQTVAAGTAIHVSGTGFGSSGTARFDGRSAAAAWSDRSITVTVPSGAGSGDLELRRGTGDGEIVDVGTYYLPGSVSGGSGGSSNSGGSGSVQSSHPTVPGSSIPVGSQPTPSPGSAGEQAGAKPGAAQDQLLLVAGRSQAPPGARVHVVAVMLLNGVPVSGVPVSFDLVSSPPGASLSTTSGVTGSDGKAGTYLRLSRTPGDHLILARSGIYTDEVHVLGAVPATAKSGGGLPFGLGQLNIHVSGNPVVVWLAVATAALVAFGVLVNINVLRRLLWSLTGGPLLRRMRRPRPA